MRKRLSTRDRMKRLMRIWRKTTKTTDLAEPISLPYSPI
jgi:hypothetical protein